MKLPEEIVIDEILTFEQNFELMFEGRVDASWELEESLVVQDAIEDDYEALEQRYNDYAQAYNIYHTVDHSARAKTTLLLAHTALRYSKLADEGEAPVYRRGSEQFVTRVVFNEIVETLYSESLEDDDVVNFFRITQEAEAPFMPSYNFEDDEEY
jgi:hypothetical protein